MSGSRDERARPGSSQPPNVERKVLPEDRTVEVPLRPHKGAQPPKKRPNVPPNRSFEQEAKATEEPWWRNVNRQVPAPPRSRIQRPTPGAPPPVPGSGGPPHRPDGRWPATKRPPVHETPTQHVRGAEPRQVPAGRRYGQQPDQHNAPVWNRQAQPTSVQRKSSQLPVLIAVGAVAILAGAVGLIVGLSTLDVLKGNVLDVSKAQADVQQILVDPIDGYGVTSVTDLVCNNGDDPVIEKGGTFTCEVIVDGRKRQVLAVFQDDNGTYEVDRPR